MEKLDAVCMQLIAIGESLKKFDTITDNKILSQYSQIEWKKAKGLRDIRELEEINVPELRRIFGRIQGASTGA